MSIFCQFSSLTSSIYWQIQYKTKKLNTNIFWKPYVRFPSNKNYIDQCTQSNMMNLFKWSYSQFLFSWNIVSNLLKAGQMKQKIEEFYRSSNHISNYSGLMNRRSYKVVLEPRVLPEHTSKYVDTVTVFAKNLNQRSLTPRWPLTPHLLRSYVWLYPRIIVSKSHENTSKYVDTVTFLQKTWSKGHWPLDDFWPHICWGHMCDSTQWSLCPSPMKMKIHQSMWIQWPFLQKI